MRKIITAIVPVRKGSQRVKNKNFKSFADSNLLEIKLNALKQIKTIDKIIVSTDSIIAIETAKRLGVECHERDEYFASSECSNSEFFENLAQCCEGDYLMYTPVTAPLIKIQTYYDFINRFSNSTNTYDSMVTAAYVKDHMWLDNKPLNYDPTNAPNTQDLPDILKLTYGINIISRENMIKFRNVIGNKPAFYVLEGEEIVDIDTPLDFEFAAHLYKKIKL
jgi:CMP-N-acetylneuraminic acid synthetase